MKADPQMIELAERACRIARDELIRLSVCLDLPPVDGGPFPPLRRASPSSILTFGRACLGTVYLAAAVDRLRGGTSSDAIRADLRAFMASDGPEDSPGQSDAATGGFGGNFGNVTVGG